MKKHITGGMSEKEARAMLLARGVQAFKLLAGSLPQKEPEISKFDNLPLFWFDSKYQDILVEYIYEEEDGYQYQDDIYHGQVHGVNIRFDVMVCWDCGHSLRDYFNLLSPTIRLWAHTHEGYCGLCGKWEKDDIPF